jgi:hypothetical protein
MDWETLPVMAVAAVPCTVVDAAKDSGAAGVIILRAEAKVIPLETEAKLGSDFGTSIHLLAQVVFDVPKTVKSPFALNCKKHRPLTTRVVCVAPSWTMTCCPVDVVDVMVCVPPTAPDVVTEPATVIEPATVTEDWAACSSVDGLGAWATAADATDAEAASATTEEARSGTIRRMVSFGIECCRG